MIAKIVDSGGNVRLFNDLPHVDESNIPLSSAIDGDANTGPRGIYRPGLLWIMLAKSSVNPQALNQDQWERIKKIEIALKKKSKNRKYRMNKDGI